MRSLTLLITLAPNQGACGPCVGGMTCTPSRSEGDTRAVRSFCRRSAERKALRLEGRPKLKTHRGVSETPNLSLINDRLSVRTWVSGRVNEEPSLSRSQKRESGDACSSQSKAGGQATGTGLNLLLKYISEPSSPLGILQLLRPLRSRQIWVFDSPRRKEFF